MNKEPIMYYKNMLIFREGADYRFKNEGYTCFKCTSIRSAKIRITKYINKLTKREKASLKYLKSKMKGISYDEW